MRRIRTKSAGFATSCVVFCETREALVPAPSPGCGEHDVTSRVDVCGTRQRALDAPVPGKAEHLESDAPTCR